MSNVHRDFFHALLVLSLVLSVTAANAQILTEEQTIRGQIWERISAQPFDPLRSTLVVQEAKDGLLNVSAVTLDTDEGIAGVVVDGVLEVAEVYRLDEVSRSVTDSAGPKTATVRLDMIAGTLRGVLGGETYVIGVVTNLRALDGGGESGGAVFVLIGMENSIDDASKRVALIRDGSTTRDHASNPCGAGRVICYGICRDTFIRTRSDCLDDLLVRLGAPLAGSVLCGLACPALLVRR